jgi:DNA-binding NarL/FixJ family response regulator
MADTTRILIVAGHPAVRADMRTIFQLADGIEVVGEAACLSEAIRQAQTLHPDVALVDLEMSAQDGNGYDILIQLKAQHLAKTVVVLTAHDYPAARQAAARCGADAIIIKGADFNSMLDTIRQNS